MANAFDTREGDVLVRDLITDFYVWMVTEFASLKPDRYIYPFVTYRRDLALEHAFMLAAGSGGRVFWIDRARAWTEVRRPARSH